jgi:hypothetical protein
LKNNVNDQLKDKVGISSSARKKVSDLIFGPDGIVSAKDILQLECLIDEAKEKIGYTCPDFLSYFNKRIVNILEENFATTQKIGLCMKWTNNNCESYNHVLKQAVNWKAQQLPSLVEAIHSEIQSQYKEIKRSILGFGDFVLDKQYADFVRSRDAWTRMSIAQQERHLCKFFDKVKELDPRVSRSRDGKRPAMTPKHGGKKTPSKKKENC